MAGVCLKNLPGFILDFDLLFVMILAMDRVQEPAEVESKNPTAIAIVQDLRTAEVTASGNGFGINPAVRGSARKVQKVFGKLSVLHLTITITTFMEFLRM